MNLKFIGSTVLASAMIAGATSSPAFAADEDGCFQAKSCFQVVERNYENDGKKYKIRIKNSCDKGIYVKVGFHRHAGNISGYASHIDPYDDQYFSVSGGNGTFDLKVVGSEQGSKDWVCSAKPSSSYETQYSG